MEKLDFVKPDIIDLKQHSYYNEKWLQGTIEKDPSILGLGNLQLWRSEKKQSEGGRIDTILFDPEDNNRRYVIEIQLGKTDASHIIRTIEYWDIERKRYPQFEHCAVIIAEDITSRFFNVISLFNGHIPIIAIQVKALKIKDTISLFFTKILDSQQIASELDDIPSEPTDEQYWLKKSSIESMDLVKLFKEEILVEYLNEYKLKYNKVYIGLAKDNIANNFITFTPQKQAVNISFKLDRTRDIDAKLDESNLASQWSYTKSYRNYNIKIRNQDLTKENKAILQLLGKYAYDENK